MDPYYFLSSLKSQMYDSEGYIIELDDVVVMWPDGCWMLDIESYNGHIEFEGSKYSNIKFNYSSNNIVCKNGDIVDTYNVLIKKK